MKRDGAHRYFRDRTEAGQRLADKLASSPPEPGTVVLALPRGGIPVGLPIAERYGLPLEPLVVRKLGVPHSPEFAMGAIATGGTCVLDRELIQRLGLSDATVDEVMRQERAELAERERRYRLSVPLAALKDKPVILVDDGMATGSTIQVAISALHSAEVGAITVAVPVLARDAQMKLASVAQHLVWLECPEPFESVGQSYRDFHQLADEEVVAQLARAQRLPATDISAGGTSSY